MTRRERTLQAINHQDTDIVPYNIELTGQARTRLVEHVGDPNYIARIGNHIARFSHKEFEEVEPGSGCWRDLFGVIWNRNGADKDIGVVDKLMLPESTLANYKFPDLNEAALRRNCEKSLAEAEDKCTCATIGFSMFERAWSLRGMENLLVDMIAEPAFVDELMDAICEYNIRVMNIICEYPFDIFHFGDDWGQQRGLIMGPAYWRRFIKPRMARMFARARQAGMYVSLHSCGDISELFDELIDIGLNIYQTFQPEIYDVKSVKRDYGKSLTFWGAISTQRVLPWVKPDEVKQVAREMMRTLGAGGGYIAAPTHAVPGDVPPENLVALVETFKDQ